MSRRRHRFSDGPPYARGIFHLPGLRGVVTAVGVLALTAGVVGAPAAAAVRPAFTAPAVAADKPVADTVVPHGKAPAAKPFARYDPAVDSTLPGAGSALVDFSPAAGPAHSAAAATAAKNGAVRAGSLPIALAPAPAVATRSAKAAPAQGPTSVRVALTDQKTALAAGVHGVLFSLTPQAGGSGALDVSVDDSSFAAAYGGDYAARLHLVELPVCALTTPQLAACQTETPLAPLGGSALAARVALPAAAATAPAAAGRTAAPSPALHIVALAATSGSGGSSGTYAATTLSPGGTWSMSGNSGSFTYSYPIQLPQAIGGAAPDVALSYDSSSQDAFTEGTNDQSSWIGDGWDAVDNYIERTYEACSDDSASGAPQYSGDLCWDGQQLTMSLNGQSTQIVYDAAAKTFRLADDSSDTEVEDLKTCQNGTYDDECFEVVENGVQYYFGLNQLPGYASGDTATQSAWTVPVYGAHSTDPCYDATFADASCLQGYRWNLDYVVDLEGNATAYYYTPEDNYYGADMKTSPVEYTRGGYLDRIDYGMTSSTIYSGTAPEQAVFTSAERCIPGTPTGNTCADAQFTTANAAYWPDVPIDQQCAKTGTCDNHAPTFWTRKRLTQIATRIQVGGATQQVDQYTLTQSFPDGGDHAPTLWLDSVQRTGLDDSAGGSGSLAEQPVSFDPPLQLPNRVGTLPSLPLMYHDRIQNVTTETGAQITVQYDGATCTPSNVASDPSTNTANCFPVYWTPDGAPSPELDWFQKYPVHTVMTQDLHDPNADGSYPELLTTYDYGAAGWHYDDNPVVKAKNRTYGQFRGYATVETRSGDPNVFHLTNGVKVFDQQTLTKSTYFRGMSQDTPSGTGGTTVTLTSQDGKYSATDADALAGDVFETDAYTASGGSIATAAVTIPTVIGPTATQPETGLPDLTAQIIAPSKAYTRTAVTVGWRDTETDSFYNTTLGQPTTGMPVQVDDRGDTSDPSQARCTRTRYVDNPDESLVLTAETIVSAQDCSTAGQAQGGQLVSDSRTLYDGNDSFTYDGASPAGAEPTKGLATEAEVATGATGASTASTFTLEGAVAYDTYGRVQTSTRTPDSTAPNGSSLAQTVTTTYSPASGALPTQEVTKTQVTAGTTPTYQSTTTTYDPARAVPLQKTDIDGLITSETYDPLGRLAGVWEPNESKAAGAAPNLKYTYAMSDTGPTVIDSDTLMDNGSYSVSESLYDALLRLRQTQTSAENSTTSVSDTQYDSHGWTVSTNNAYNVGGAPVASLVSVSPVTVPDTTVTDYDGQGRADLVTDEHDQVRTSSSATAYAGDRTTVIPPTGGVAQTTYTNALGQTTELDQYTAAPTLSGSSQSGFTVSGGTTQPTTYTYTPAGQQQSVTGADGSVWSYQYDLQGDETQETDPDTGESTFGYDDAADQVSTTSADKVTLEYTYDLLGRKLTETNTGTGFEDASWLYDTLQVGKQTSSTRYVPGVTGGYTVAMTGYTALGKPTGTKITLPSSEAPLPTTYTTSDGYSTNAELLTSQVDPRVAGLLGETISYGYDTLDNPTTLSSSLWTYVQSTVYSDYGDPLQVLYGPSTNQAYQDFSYDDQTKRVTNITTGRSQAPGPVVDSTSYTYDASGNPLTDTDQQEESGNTVTDTQCYNYNALDELSEAWTAAGVCPAEGQDPTAAGVASGANAYWQSYTYDSLGDRKIEVDHAVDGQTGDTSTDYTNGGPTSCSATADQPHSLSQITTTGPAGTSTTGFCYDAAGQTVSRTPSAGNAQSMTWNDEGDLASVTENGTTSSYVYDADGNLLIRRDPGQTTLFAGDTQVVVDTAVTPNVLLGAVRTYNIGDDGNQVAVRSSLPGGGVDYSFADPHGTTTMEMDVTTQAVSRQEYTPYGAPRGSAAPGWIDPTHGFLNKPVDAATGYTDLGAREYDPTLGRFLSSDPLTESTDPAQLGGYTYSGDNPIMHDDPSGRSWWSTITRTVNTVANIAQKVAPVLDVIALATAAVPGLDVVTASAAGIANTVNTVASVAQGAVSVINDVRAGKSALDIGLDVANTALSVAGDRALSSSLKGLRGGARDAIGAAERDSAHSLESAAKFDPPNHATVDPGSPFRFDGTGVARRAASDPWGDYLPDAPNRFQAFLQIPDEFNERLKLGDDLTNGLCDAGSIAPLKGFQPMPYQLPTPFSAAGTDGIGGATLIPILVIIGAKRAVTTYRAAKSVATTSYVGDYGTGSVGYSGGSHSSGGNDDSYNSSSNGLVGHGVGGGRYLQSY